MKRNLIISGLLALLVLVFQVLARVGTGVVALSTVLAFAISMGVLAVSDRFGRKG